MAARTPFKISILLILFFIVFMPVVPSVAQDNSEQSADETWLLRFDPEPGAVYTYSLSTSGSRGDRIAVMTENYTVSVGEISDGEYALIAEGEDVPDGAPLGFRFQRAYFPQFLYTVSGLGETGISYGQPFPPFLNIPFLPMEEVSVGSSWSGGPVDILPDKNVGNIPFTYASVVASVASFRGENCAVIETTYEVAIDEPVQSLRPFLGIVEGDPPDEPGNGALVGGIVERSRAEDAGIEPGDLIIEIEGERIRGWGGLEEILPLIVPEKELELTIQRGEEEIDMVIIPEGVPVADVTAAGGMISTCFFSLDRGIPLKIDVASEDLIFLLAMSDEDVEEKEAALHFVWEYQYAGR